MGSRGVARGPGWAVAVLRGRRCARGVVWVVNGALGYDLSLYVIVVEV